MNDKEEAVFAAFFYKISASCGYSIPDLFRRFRLNLQKKCKFVKEFNIYVIAIENEK